MYCKYCGKEINDNSKFCKYCGINLENTKAKLRVIELVNKIIDIKNDKKHIKKIIIFIIFMILLIYLIPVIIYDRKIYKDRVVTMNRFTGEVNYTKIYRKD